MLDRARRVFTGAAEYAEKGHTKYGGGVFVGYRELLAILDDYERLRRVEDRIQSLAKDQEDYMAPVFSREYIQIEFVLRENTGALRHILDDKPVGDAP